MLPSPLKVLLNRSCFKNDLSLKKLLWHFSVPKRHLQMPRRFYKNVTVSRSNGLYEINLDNRKLKTPSGKIFQVPSEALAIAVATEWEVQTGDINLLCMHMTRLCNTALDNPTKKTKESLSESILTFLDTDTICYRQEEPRELAELQTREWDSVLEWFCKRYGVDIKSSRGLDIIGVSEETKEIMMRHLLSFNFWSLTGIHYVVDALKSAILGLATIDRFVSVEEAVALSQLETEFQISRWGNVEWAHDIDRFDLRARVAAAVLFAYFSNEYSSVKSTKNQH